MKEFNPMIIFLQPYPRRLFLDTALRIKEEEVPRTDYIYAFLSKFDLNSFIAMILRILNSITKKRRKNTKLIALM